ncbi:hypothetical protein TNCV_1220031 [Trichonephila clavipes]|nr:hypothetical protein TNCV_1220031 [Trichonephila clavipes]
MQLECVDACYMVDGHWALRCRSRCSDQVISLKRDPQCLKSPIKLGTHLSTHCSAIEDQPKVKELMHVKFVVTPSAEVDVVFKFGE